MVTIENDQQNMASDLITHIPKRNASKQLVQIVKHVLNWSEKG